MVNYNTLYHMVGVKDLQEFLNFSEGNNLQVDGIIGRKTWRAIRETLNTKVRVPDGFDAWPDSRKFIAFQQYFLSKVGCDPIAIDGLYGPDTEYAVECYQNKLRQRPSVNPVDDVSPWPHEKDAELFYGSPGANHIRLQLPYQMRLAWNPDQVINSFIINRRCAASAQRVLTKVLNHYGFEDIKRLRLDLFAGCFSNRSKRGGSAKSMHAYACAIDFDSANNRLRWDNSKAKFAQPEYDAWWMFWEEEYWVSLGRERNYDWMHVQAAQI